MSTMIQFEDKLVPYEVFVKDLARELTAQTCEALRLNNNIVSQNQAFKQFGAGNVRRSPLGERGSSYANQQAPR